MGSKNGKKLKFSVESILQPTVDVTTSKSCPEPIPNIYYDQVSINSTATQAVSSPVKLNSGKYVSSIDLHLSVICST